MVKGAPYSEIEDLARKYGWAKAFKIYNSVSTRITAQAAYKNAETSQKNLIAVSIIGGIAFVIISSAVLVINNWDKSKQFFIDIGWIKEKQKIILPKEIKSQKHTLGKNKI